ncbi:hypothetical protein AB0F73_19800, partial [Micromonospora purpureochromogenes]|uniref:DUF6959 family protein n=1 Tax=Micromonospora purpureochromogenes TaxID=47872 RepID=UPI0033F00D25
MERIEVDLHERGNAAVLRLPPRRFPGVLIQGDSLSVLREDVELVRAALRAGDLVGGPGVGRPPRRRAGRAARPLRRRARPGRDHPAVRAARAAAGPGSDRRAGPG